jgi:sarcosine oxidase subunit beta
MEPSELPKTADLVIIGGGIVGVASAFFAQRAGLRCVVLEKRPLLCTLTTPASTGAFRAQFDNPEEINLVLESIEFFTHFGEIAGISNCDVGVRQQGYLWVTTDPEKAEKQKELVAQQHAWGLRDVELLAGGEARRRFPHLSPDVISARYRARDGWLDPRKLTLEMARSSGAVFCVDTAVTGFETKGGRIAAVQTSRGAVTCQAALIAAGPFSGQVARTAGIDLPLILRVRQKLVLPEVPEIPQQVPMTIDEDTGAHWRPASSGAFVLRTQPDTPPTPPLEDVPTSVSFLFDVMDPGSRNSVARISPLWRNVWKGQLRSWYLMAGQYVYTPDHRPLLGASSISNLWLNCGYSGHGIMGSPAGSRLVIDQMVGKLKAEENPFRPDRKMVVREFDVL